MKYLLVIILLTLSLSAQDPRYGFNGAYSLNTHTGDFTGIPGYESCCPGFREGSGSGPNFGFIYQYPIISKLYLDLKANINSLNGELSRNENTLVSVNGVITNGVFSHDINTSIMNFNISVGASYNIFQNFNLSAAFGIGPNIGGTFDQKEEIVEPSNTGVFIDEETQENLGRIRNQITGDINDLNSSLLNLSIGANYLLPLNSESTLFLVPEINYIMFIGDQVKELDWSITSMNFGIGVRYAPKRPKKEYLEKYYIDTVRIKKDYIKEDYISLGAASENEKVDKQKDVVYFITEITRTDTLFIQGEKPVQDFARNKPEVFKQLSGELEILGLDSNNRPVEFNEISLKVELTREIYPLLPYVFFDENSNVIPNRYERVISPSDFHPEDLDPSPIVYHRNNLNIIGKRLMDYPEATLTLSGYVDPTTEENKCDLAYNRAVSVKGYLMRVYGIEEDRIKIKENSKCYPKELTRTQSSDGYAENRRVEISSNKPELLFAVTRTWLQEPTVINPASIIIHTMANQVESEKEIPLDEIFYPKKSNYNYSLAESWDLFVDQGNFTLLNESGSNEEQEIPLQITRNNARKLVSNIPIFINLNVFGESGMSISKSKELKVTKDTADIEVEKLTLTVFRVSQATLDRRIKEEIREFVTGLDQNAEVNIIGYSDNLGDASQNKALSAVRAEEVRKYIRSIAPKARFGIVEGVGSNDFPPGVYSYESPEERFISRTVEIEIRNKAR